MKNTLLLFLAISLAFITACKNKSKTIEASKNQDFQNAFSIHSEFIDETSQLEVTINLADNVHAYAPGEKIGKPIKLDISEINGWSRNGATTIPAGKRKYINGLSESVVLEKSVRLSQKLNKGFTKGEALLHLQVCTATACDRPRVHRLPLVSHEFH